MTEGRIRSCMNRSDWIISLFNWSDWWNKSRRIGRLKGLHS